MAGRKVDMTRRSYKEFIKMYEKMSPKEFRAFYTAQRDVVHKQLMRLSKSTGDKANIGKDYLEGKHRILTLAEIDNYVKEHDLSPMQAAREYASALSNINYIYHAKRASLTGWSQIIKKIQKTLKENNYGDISKEQLEMMGDLMARVYAIYGRNYAPSEEIMDAISKGLGPALLSLSDKQLSTFLKYWKGVDNIDLS